MVVEVEAQTVRVGARDVGLPAALLTGAAAGWWLSARMAADMDGGGSPSEMSMSGGMSLVAYLLGWVAMMVAMMFPAIAPVVRLYARAAGRGTVAPVSVFVAGYLLVWSAIGAPAYFLWRALDEPLAMGEASAGRFAGVVLVAAAGYQLTSYKQVCLRHCRSPMSVFTHTGGNPARPTVAMRIGAFHGLYCLGCCWALMAILVAMGTMNLAWMAVLTLVIFIEKVAPRGEIFVTVFAVAAAGAGLWLLSDPSMISTIT